MKQKSWSWMTVGTALICILAIIYTVFTIFCVNFITLQTTKIYDHPYLVMSEARAMETRLSELESYLPTLLTIDYEDANTILQMLEDRHQQQDQSLTVLRERYLGSKDDLEALETAVAALRDAQTKAAWDCQKHIELEDAMVYMERYITPHTATVRECLQTVIRSADGRVDEFRAAAEHASLTTACGAVLLCILIIGMSLGATRNEQRKNREIAYREKLFDLLAINIDDVFFIYDCQSASLEYVSGNSARILGLNEQSYRDDIRVLCRQMPPESVGKLKEMFSDGPLHTNMERDLQYNKDGQLRELKVRVYPIRNGQRLQRYIVVLSDQTEAVLYQQALRDALVSAQNANAAKRDFLSRMSHEIRTPMNAVIGMTAIALKRIDDKERVTDCLSKITYSSKHLLSLINDVLDMSKIEDGKLTVSHELFDFRRLVEAVTSIVYPQAMERGQNFEVSMSGVTVERLVGDSMRVNQVLLNLLSNAIKFTPEGGEIRLEIHQLRIKQGRAFLRFVVRDTGIGMNEEFQQRLYRPFEQANASISQQYGGTGLGMSITKNLVSMMGGTITVHSVEGRGTTFAVELPFDLPEEALQAVNPVLETLRVMVVDDDRDTCEHASLLLEQLGVQADWVLNGREAVAKVVRAHEEGTDYDVCFIDWRMPDMDGVETTRQIRRHVGPDTLIIIISAYDWGAIEREAREAGANAFVAKPFFASSLYNTLLSVTCRGGVVSIPAEAERIYDFSGNKVLLAEDNHLNREIAVEILKMVGLEVDCAEDGQAALTLFRESQPEEYALILMDVQMPRMNGYEATRAIRASDHPRAGTVPILAMTANAFSDDVSAAIEAGMNGHLAKPIDVDVLYRAIAPYMK